MIEEKFSPTVCSDCCQDLIYIEDGKYKIYDKCGFNIKECNDLIKRDKPDYEQLVNKLNDKQHS